jgi:recombination protein RecA
MKIGVMFGSLETTTGGNALKFYASVRLDIRRIGALKDGEQVQGNRTRVKVVKNKLAAPFREVEFDVLYGQGISLAGEVIDLGVEHGILENGILEKSGAWISFGGERLGNGRDAVRDRLIAQPEVLRREAIDVHLSAEALDPSAIDAGARISRAIRRSLANGAS